MTSHSNSHVLDFLNYYCDLANKLDFAVLVRGAWGAGKTHLITEFLNKREREGAKKALRVSLYGMTTTTQIEDEFYRQLHPFLTSKGMKIASALTKAVLKSTLKFEVNDEASVTAGAQVPELKLSEIYSVPEECLLVFDDLERAAMPLSEIMGFINHLVEYQNFKAIIVANEDDILKHLDEEKNARYKEIKEKLIGQTLEVKTRADSVLPGFLPSLKDERTRDFLTAHVAGVLAIHAQSETNNLRSLKQSLWAFERFTKCLADRHWKNHDAIAHMLKTIVPLHYEMRAGRLDSNQLESLKESTLSRYRREKNGEDVSLATQLQSRYEVDFSSSVLTPSQLRALLFEGWCEVNDIRASLDKSLFYASPASIPAWRLAWNSWDLDDETFERAVSQLEKEFRDRSLKVSGEMLHLFGLRLSFAAMGVIDRTVGQVVEECKRYVDDLDKKSSLSPLEEFQSLYMGWDGLGFTSSDTEEFKQLVQYTMKIAAEARDRKLPEFGRELLQMLNKDAHRYFRKLSPNNVEAATWIDVPVLSAVPVDEFVSSLLKLSPSAFNIAMTTFKGRYETGRLANSLKPEMEWLKHLKDVLVGVSKDLKPLSRRRLLQGIQTNIDPFIKAEGEQK